MGKVIDTSDVKAWAREYDEWEKLTSRTQTAHDHFAAISTVNAPVLRVVFGP